MSTAKRMTSLFVIAALAFCFLAVIWTAQQEDVRAAVSKAAAKKAKTYTKSKNKLFKVNGYWYCFSAKKVRKGLRKVGSDYYFFSNSTGKMYLKSGLKKIDTAYYYFNKKSGKAPALRNKARKISGKVWFFRTNGKRYKYSYLDTGSSAGNSAAGVIISGASIIADGKGGDAALKAAYKRIAKNNGYGFISPSVPKTKADLGKLAKYLTDNKAGKCYHYAALTYVAFKALGATPVYYNGKFLRTAGKDPGEHAWVVLSGSEETELIYDTNQDNVNNTASAFYGKLITYEDESRTSFKIEGKDFIYYPKSQIK